MMRLVLATMISGSGCHHWTRPLHNPRARFCAAIFIGPEKYNHGIVLRSLTASYRQETRAYPIRVGVFSVLPPQTTRWEEHNLNETVVADDIVVAARSLTNFLREKGCDLIVALAHSGLGNPDTATDTENAVIPLAAIEGIDAVVAGHTHLTLPARTSGPNPECGLRERAGAWYAGCHTRLGRRISWSN